MSIRSHESPLMYKDMLKIVDLLHQNIESNDRVLKMISDLKSQVRGEHELEKVDIQKAMLISGRSRNTIKQHCKVIGKGFNNRDLFDLREVEALK